MTPPARGDESNVVYPNFGSAAAEDNTAFEWPEHVDWSEIAPDEDVPAKAEGSHENEAGEATVIEFPAASKEL